MTSDPYAAGYTFARSAFAGPHPGPKGCTYDIYIYTDSEIIVLTRWGSLRLAPIKLHGVYTVLELHHDQWNARHVTLFGLDNHAFLFLSAFRRTTMRDERLS